MTENNGNIQICSCGAVYFKEGTPESIGETYGYPVGHNCPLEKPVTLSELYRKLRADDDKG